MIAILLLSTSLLLVPAPSPSLGVQDEEGGEVQDKRPEIKELLGELSDHVKERGEEDEQAIAVIDKLYQEFPDSGPKDREAIVKGLERCFKSKRTKELEPGVPDDRLYMACATAMKDMGPESVKPLMGQIGNRRIDDNLRLQRQLILSLGKTRDPDAVDLLVDLLKAPKSQIQAAGAEALGEFSELEQDDRKEVFEELLKILMGQKARKDTAPNDLEAVERWNTISGPIIASLQRLSGNDERDPAEWQRWWNKNKKEDWDEE